MPGFCWRAFPMRRDLASALGSGKAQGAAATVMAFEALFAAFCLPFLRVAMARERRTGATAGSGDRLPHRRAEPRAFFERGHPLLERSVAERQPAALLLFDLDRFKEVNDTAGQQTGDRVLRAFCDLVGAQVRPGDLFGRLGGEEFAYLMVNVSVAQAMQAAERLRSEFASLQFADLPISPTVSVGVAMASEAGRNPTRRCTGPRPTAAIGLRRRPSSGSRPRAAKRFAARSSGRCRWRGWSPISNPCLQS